MNYIYSVLMALVLMHSPAASAKMELEEAYFTGNQQLYPGANEEWDTDFVEVGWGHYQYRVNGTVVLKSFDDVTYAKQIIKIPANLKLDAWGAIAMARASYGFFLDLTNLEDQLISGIFNHYYGGQLGVAALVSVGFKQMCTSEWVCLDGWNTLVVGLGLNVSYMEATLSTGHFVPGNTTVINATVETSKPSETITKEMPIEQVMKLRVE